MNEVFFIDKIPVKTIKKIEEDIEKNDLGKARDRLHGLISTFPNELDLRRKLGDIYIALKYPSMAGRYWYLEKNKSPEMVKACIQFEKSMGNDPIRIGRAIKFKGDSEVLKRLQLDQVISPIQNKVKENLLEEPEDPFKDKLVIFGCFSIIILTIIFALIGVYALFNWIF
ncbi:DNA helicase [Peribacillus sp. CSMR9]|nr:DNA helicase [Peribacillus sp. CSMR9]